ncbi:MAG TPA: hypothetical protein PKK36_11460, partial [Kiritimatiellia bacterium]|nr:hypothetical protein [Kiritimatiellia bacterium]
SECASQRRYYITAVITLILRENMFPAPVSGEEPEIPGAGEQGGSSPLPDDFQNHTAGKTRRHGSLYLVTAATPSREYESERDISSSAEERLRTAPGTRFAVRLHSDWD